MCVRQFQKDLPKSLCAEDLRGVSSSGELARAMRAPIIVLVAGDVGQQISSGRDFHSGARFLYLGSEFDRHRAEWHPNGDVSQDFVDLVFYSSVTLFAQRRQGGPWLPSCTVPMQSGVVLLPRVLRETQLHRFTRWFENALRKSTADSMWLVQRGAAVDAYSEPRLSLAKMAGVKRPHDAR